MLKPAKDLTYMSLVSTLHTQVLHYKYFIPIPNFPTNPSKRNTGSTTP
jgi:hypothetical protein